MGACQSLEVSEFCLEGRFIDFVIKDGYKLKGLLLSTHDGECYVKLAKHLRAAFDLRLPRGTWLQVFGYKKYDIKKDKVTLKAERVMAARSEMAKVQAIAAPQEPPSIDSGKVRPPKTKATILVCQKSDCMKRGGRGVCQALEAALSDRGLEDQVTIKGTGCMKNCKGGPNVVMPDKTRYSQIQASQVPALMNKHFADKGLEPQPPESFKEVPIINPKFC
ncbi:MAG: (2Fe-2S) ferredoxin domain-containing protein [Nostoc sp. ZfuVER08]|uniref:(2Fe-2S) ferredoxin domain-containing protein n=1 Tax=Nostoc punctiforme FACHB-252 TaxID=1357509 RepID=A0ABR8H5G8_NOSPU|nr:(2Fe-2S) ferredoxin domain-containing protein [Nostoc punctiforme]MBD2610628.1 (2Fe-2S) ferredoxin domain-containing protein [Nostoc punctiforme FACHB-252]MBL1198407.1 (2Fe-2S) ferredoxin domain-containing protein [Nostoc sp. GBBB01]MDZ8010106.1 (2Fe-2S) ferredoxin domain-containing protein [Nostoc sp. ZfuVER08]